MWDPWDATFDDKTAAQLFKSEGFTSVATGTTTSLYGDRVIYFET